MSQCQAVDSTRSVYNAVNIKINNPRATVSDRIKTNSYDGEFNAVSLEINNPELKQKPFYNYPKYDTIVTHDYAGYTPVDMPEIPVIPVAYKTSYINNRTYISTDLDSKDSGAAKNIEVPAPNITTAENEKNLTFHGIAFKADKKPEIVPDAKIKPAVDIATVTKNLASSNYDIQALQLKDIFSAAIENNGEALPYISTPVFNGIINIIEKDTSNLEKPTDEQIEIRKKIIANQRSAEQQLAEGKKADELELPYTVSEDELKKAIKLSPFEMAERNKTYAIYALTTLTDVYAKEFEKKTGNVVPLTDLPGASTIVDVLKKDQNTPTKTTAIEALVYLNRPEYKSEISAILKIAANDENPIVAMTAADALKII